MASEWRPGKLGDYVKLQSGGTPSKSRPDFWSGDIPWVSAKDMKTFWVEDSEDHLTEAGAAKARIVPARTTLILVRGMTLHNDIPICRLRRPSAFNQDVKAVIPQEGLDSEFLPYLLVANKTSLLNSVDSAGHGTGRLNTETLTNLPVSIPPLEEQKSLADFANAIEDKIELNRRMNATLEAMARALFKAWFVDFEPVHANKENRPSTSASPEIAKLFPSEFENGIPKSWKEKGLDEIADFLNGLALQKYPPESENEFLPVIKIAQLRKGSTEGSDRASKYLKPEYIVRDGDILFSWSGSLEVEIWSGGDGALNQHLFKVTSEKYPKWFYFMWTRFYLADFRATAAHKATTMGHIQRYHVSDAKVLVPSAELLGEMTTQFEPIFKKLVSNNKEARNLSNIRDSLLPRLISGRIRIA